MTLDEAIELEYELSCKYVQEEKNNYDAYGIYGRWADKHKQYAKWLEELKDYRRFNGAKTFDNGFKQGEKYGYNKAIDDLTEKISKYRTYDDWGNVINVLKIAEELKKHKTLNIVHCKDCKHWGTGVAGETENIKCCEYGKYMVGDNGYCCYGEKECAE